MVCWYLLWAPGLCMEERRHRKGQASAASDDVILALPWPVHAPQHGQHEVGGVRGNVRKGAAAAPGLVATTV